MEADSLSNRTIQASTRLKELTAKNEGFSPLQSVLIDRLGLEQKKQKQFLYPSILNIHSPFLLPDMDAALNRFQQAVSDKQKIYVFGDKDVDGISSTCLLASLLQDLMPADRYTLDISQKEDTYGLSGAVVERIKTAGADLVFALDCGTSNWQEIAELRAAGTDVIVIDHHTIPENPIDGLLINPRLADNEFPMNEIATVGLVCLFILGFCLLHTKVYQGAFLIKSEAGEEDVVVKKGRPAGEASDTIAGDITEVFYQAPAERKPGQLYLEEQLRKLATANKHLWPEISRIKPYLDKPKKTAEDIFQIFLFYSILSRPGLYDRFLHSLDLTAIGTVTDMVSLQAENRIFVKNGIISLRKTKKPGLQSLFKALRLPESEISYRQLGWDLGPHLNAPGRMGQSNLCKELLLSETTDAALATAKSIVSLNKARKSITFENLELVESEVYKKAEGKKSVIYYHEDLKPGVTGLVASRLSDRLRIPVVLMGPENDIIKGSIRSAVRTNVVKLLKDLSGQLLEYGGHPQAAGFTLSQKQLPGFIETWEKDYSDLEYKADDDQFIVEIELKDLNIGLYQELLFLEPFGVGNPAPKFLVRNVTPQAFRYMGDPAIHGKFEANGKPGIPVDFIIWQRGVEMSEFMTRYPTFDVLGTLDMNRFGGRRTMQFSIEEFGV